MSLDRYASRHPPTSKSVQDKLRIDLFAEKHDVTIEQVEVALMKVEEDEDRNMGIFIRNLGVVQGSEYKYEVRVNSDLITEFTCKRTVNGLSRCLRAAADAVGNKEDGELIATANVGWGKSNGQE